MGACEKQRDEQKIELQATVKRFLRYWWTHYKVHIIFASVVVIVFLLNSISSVTAKETILTGVLLNSGYANSEASVTSMSENYFSKYGLDSTEARIEYICDMTFVTKAETISTDNLTTIEFLTTQSAAGMLDFVIGDFESMSVLAYSKYFVDLSTVLTEEQMAMYEPYLLYMDHAVVERLELMAASDNFDAEIAIPDYSSPEGMIEPIPIFVDISKCEEMQSIYSESEMPVVFAVAENAPYPDAVQNLLDLLME